MMQRWILQKGVYDASALLLQDVAAPEPGAGEVRVRMRAASLNFRDKIVLGDPHWRLPDHDLVPLSDGAGEIDAIGPGVTEWSVGDRVVSLQFRGWREGPPTPSNGMGLAALNDDGVLAEQVILAADRIAPMPNGYSFAEAATLPIAGVTAWNALYGDRPIKQGSKVLVLGTGGVAIWALLLAKAADADVFATSSDDGKLDRLKALGADQVLNYRQQPEWGQAIAELSGGVDKVVDSVGMINQSLAALKPGGEEALFGLMGSDGAPNPMLLLGKSVTIRGIVVGHAGHYAALVKAIEEGGLRPPLDDRFRFSFKDAPAAYAAQSSPDLFGKIVVDIS